MVADTAYYDLLGVAHTATALEIKKAYRKAAIKLHPDKNPDDPQAIARFQAVGEAYQVLSDDRLREKYDKYGKQESVPSEGFEDPTEFFSMIFGGEAFKDWIGELSLLQEMTKTAELSAMDDDTDSKAKESEDAPTTNPASAPATDKASLFLEDGSTLIDANGKRITHQEAEKRRRQEELEKFEEECRVKKIETRAALAKTLTQKLALFTETDMAPDVENSFRQKLQYEAESLKMESFGLEILHTLGAIYKTKAKILLKSQTFLGGLGGLWWSMKDKGGVIRDTFKTVSSALDAQLTMEEYSKMQADNEYHAKKDAEAESEEQDPEAKQKAQAEMDRLAAELQQVQLEQKEQKQEQQKQENEQPQAQTQEKGTPAGEDTPKEAEEKEPERHSAEELAEMEKYLLGKVLAAAWSGSKFEIQGTVRAVCDEVLYEEGVPLEVRVARAKGLKIIGQVFALASRTELEDEEARMFEELVAEASQKRKKKSKNSAELEHQK